MRRKIVALTVVAIVTTTGIAMALVLNPYGDKFHFESRFAAGRVPSATYIILDLAYLSDCNLTISFVNDTLLVYRMDVELYAATFRNSAFALSENDYSPSRYGVGFYPSVHTKSLNIVLGTAKPYEILVRQGTNLSSTVTYSSGAVLGKEFMYTATGSLHFFILQNVSFTTHGLDVFVGEASTGPDATYLYVALPPGLNGKFYCALDPDPQIVHDEGWFYRVDGSYSTVLSPPQPCLTLGVVSYEVVAYLNS